MSFDKADLPVQFGSYVLKQKIARGGMAELYLGEAQGPGGFSKPVVIKMIHDAFSKDPRFESMFNAEANMVAGLVHGNIVPIFDFGSVEGRTYLAMEFIDGVDVASLLETCRTKGIVFPTEVALWIAIGAAAALHHAHSATDQDGQPLGIVHRDVSPHNILTSRAGEGKLCDFGIAHSAVKSGGTDSGVIKGKLRYLSPEQATGGSVDPRTDIFALGVVLYEMVAGHHPLPGAAGVSVLQTLTRPDGRYPALRDAAPWVAESLAALIDRAVAFAPEARYQTAEELRQDLSRVLYGEFPDFSPTQLAALVIAVQEEVEHESSERLDSVIRSRLASFASNVRGTGTAETAAAEPPAPSIGRRRIAIGLLALVLLAGGVVTFLMFGEQLSSEPDPTRRAGIPERLDSPGPAMPQRPDAGTPAPPVAATTTADAGARTPDAAPHESTAPRPPIAPPPRRGHGFLEANASPWAEVRIDGVAHGSTPIIGLKLPAGRHRAVFKHPDLGTVQRSFVIRAGETSKLIVEMGR